MNLKKFVRKLYAKKLAAKAKKQSSSSIALNKNKPVSKAIGTGKSKPVSKAIGTGKSKPVSKRASLFSRIKSKKKQRIGRKAKGGLAARAAKAGSLYR